MSVLYCTVPDRVKYSTVIADEYRKVTEKIDYWRTNLGYIFVYWVRVELPTTNISLVLFCLFFGN